MSGRLKTRTLVLCSIPDGYSEANTKLKSIQRRWISIIRYKSCKFVCRKFLRFAFYNISNFSCLKGAELTEGKSVSGGNRIRVVGTAHQIPWTGNQHGTSHYYVFARLQLQHNVETWATEFFRSYRLRGKHETIENPPSMNLNKSI